MVGGGEQEHAVAAAVLGSSDFFRVNRDHRPGFSGSALSCLLADPFVDHRVQYDRIDSGCCPMDRGHGGGFAAMKVEPVFPFERAPIR